MEIEQYFRICGSVGFGLALLLATNFVNHTHLLLSVLAVVVGTGIATFFVLAAATKLIIGKERIIYYHHEVAVLAMVWLSLVLLRQPTLPYLDVTILGIGTFLTCGRIGCLMVGCCHGRPSLWGIQYGHQHVVAGFPSYLVGVRLFPIQAVESLWVLLTVAVGTIFVWSGRPPGTALAWYITVYNLGRFCFEFARGDADRPYWLGFSQPQWISLILTSGIVYAERVGSLPFVYWHGILLTALAAGMIAVAIKRRIQATSIFELLHPTHVKEFASAVTALNSVSYEPSSLGQNHRVVIPIARTSLGIQMSGGQIRIGDKCVHHYTLSSERTTMTARVARVLAHLLRSLKGRASSHQLIAGCPGVFHVVLTEPMTAKS